MKTTQKIANLEDQLAKFREALKQTTDPDTKAELEETIDALQDDVDELEESISDQDSWEEMTGTTPQDLYIERNSYAISQGEAIERFRNEY